MMSVFYFFQKQRYLVAFCCAFIAMICLWQGITDMSFSQKALAVNTIHEKQEPDLDNARALTRLATGVDNLSVSLGGIMKGLDNEEKRLHVLRSSLNSLSQDSSKDTIYYTAWQGTTLVYSPLNPDISGKDYKDFVDGQGVPFVSLMADQAFLGIHLRVAPNQQTPDGGKEKLAYAKTVPHTNWHIAAFLTPQDHSIEQARLAFEKTMRQGFLFLGVSFAGLAGLIVIHRPEKKESA